MSSFSLNRPLAEAGTNYASQWILFTDFWKIILVGTPTFFLNSSLFFCSFSCSFCCFALTADNNGGIVITSRHNITSWHHVTTLHHAFMHYTLEDKPTATNQGLCTLAHQTSHSNNAPFLPFSFATYSICMWAVIIHWQNATVLHPQKVGVWLRRQ